MNSHLGGIYCPFGAPDHDGEHDPTPEPRKVYEIVLPDGFDHNDYDLFGTTDPDESPKFG